MKKFKRIFIFIKIISFSLAFISEFNHKTYSNEKINAPNIEYLKKINSSDDYIIGPGDRIKLIVNKDTEDLNKIFNVDGEGNAVLERLNKVYVSGLTIIELTLILNEAYSQYVNEPNVTLEMINYRPIKIFIDGEVINPGLIILPGNFKIGESKNIELDNGQVYFPTLFDAIQKAGGITNFADLSKIKVVRRDTISNGGGKKAAELDLTKSLNFGDGSQNIRILDEDSIYITKNEKPILEQISKAIKSNLNPKFINVYVSGRVENPGEIQINKLSTLNEAIALAGGAKVLKGKVSFTRYKNDGTVDFRKFSFDKKSKRGSYANPYLRQGDVIYFGKSNINIANEVITELTNPLRGIVTAFGFYKIITE